MAKPERRDGSARVRARGAGTVRCERRGRGASGRRHGERAQGGPGQCASRRAHLGAAARLGTSGGRRGIAVVLSTSGAVGGAARGARGASACARHGKRRGCVTFGSRGRREEKGGEGRRREKEGKRKGRERKGKEKGEEKKEKEKERKLGKRKGKGKERKEGKRVTRAGDIHGGDRGWSATRARRSHAARGEEKRGVTAVGFGCRFGGESGRGLGFRVERASTTKRF
jgi:hypothetical protein